MNDTERITKVAEVLTRVAASALAINTHVSELAKICEHQQLLIEAQQTQLDDIKMRLAVLESAREKGRT